MVLCAAAVIHPVTGFGVVFAPSAQSSSAATVQPGLSIHMKSPSVCSRLRLDRSLVWIIPVDTVSNLSVIPLWSPYSVTDLQGPSAMNFGSAYCSDCSGVGFCIECVKEKRLWPITHDCPKRKGELSTWTFRTPPLDWTLEGLKYYDTD